MNQGLKKYWLVILTLLLLVFTVWVIQLNLRASNRVLTLAMLDVGQGDAIFIESPTGTQILIDGGPPRRVLSHLAKLMPPFDRTIDALIITNPDLDHIGGFLDVLKVYKVGHVFEPGTFNDSSTYENLKDKIKDKNIKETLARSGMRIDIGGGAVIDILFPDRDVSTWTTNDGSVVAKLSYGETTVMLMGDSTTETEKVVLTSISANSVDSDVLKVGHHGSQTSTSTEFVQAATPKYALISAGKDNRYGHPHDDVLETLTSAGVEILRTDTSGSIVMKSDGGEPTFSFSR